MRYIEKSFGEVGDMTDTEKENNLKRGLLRNIIIGYKLIIFDIL